VAGPSLVQSFTLAPTKGGSFQACQPQTRTATNANGSYRVKDIVTGAYS